MLTALIILFMYLTSRIGARTAVICQVYLAVALVVIIATWCYQANNFGKRGKRMMNDRNGGVLTQAEVRRDRFG